MILDGINSPKDVKKLNKNEKVELAAEIRQEILDVVSKNGGHLASNLGIVELTIAIHSVFDLAKDKVIWDVGHQCYVHKLLTGRRKKFKTLRKKNGLAGFPKTSESKYDHFNTGHSSTSISAALGMARARDILGKKETVIAVIGDGALTGGMALEALNDAGNSKTDLIVILNDNEMSISKNLGGISRVLTKLRTKKIYTTSNGAGKKIIRKIPVVGEKIVDLVINIKKSIKQLIIPKMYFENIGFKYLGPVDGHNIEDLENILRDCSNIPGPILIHAITKKGKGYLPAEETPNKFHSISSFDIMTGQKLSKSKKDYSKAFGEKLVQMAKKNKKIIAITAAMEEGTGLQTFANTFPNRFFNVEIAEEHALGMAAGMAKEGLIPFVPIYSSFLQRAYDQVVHDICLQKLPVVICIDRAVIVGNDGETHQGMLDFSFLNTVPGMVITAPKDFKELEMLMEFAAKYKAPISIRYPRGSENSNVKFDKYDKIKLGKAELLREGDDVTIIAIGKMTSYALEAIEKVKEQNISADLINVRFLKPIDKDLILESCKKTKKVITIEDGSIKGGLGSTVLEVIKESNLEDISVKVMAYPDKFIRHGSVDDIEEAYDMNTLSIVRNIENLVSKNEEENE